MKLKLLITSDLHGSVSPYRYSDNELVTHGLSRLSKFINGNRDVNTLLIDNGDTLQGTPLVNYHQSHARDKKHPMATVLNHLNYDYVNIGNHDFNYGKEMLCKYINDLNAQCITGNVIKEGEKQRPIYMTKMLGGHKICLIGAVTQYISNWEKAANIEGLEFINAFDYVRDTMNYVIANDAHDVYIVAYHGGFECDIHNGKETEKNTGENLGYKMCQEIDGIDILITGHQHRSIIEKCKDTFVCQTAYEANEMAYIVLDLDTKEITGELIQANYDVDEDLLNSIAEVEEATQRWLDQPLGELKDGPCEIKDGFQARLNKHKLLSLLNQIQMNATGADLSVVPLFNTSVGFKQSITMRDLVSTYLYPATLVKFKINGEQLKRFLEKCAEYFVVKDGKIVVSDKYIFPKPQHYNYDMMDGVSYVIKCSNPIGQRIVKMEYQGKTVKDDDTFTICMGNYRANGGGEYHVVEELEVLNKYTEDVVELIASYIEDNSPVVIDHHDNITVEV